MCSCKFVEKLLFLVNEPLVLAFPKRKKKKAQKNFWTFVFLLAAYQNLPEISAKLLTTLVAFAVIFLFLLIFISCFKIFFFVRLVFSWFFFVVSNSNFNWNTCLELFSKSDSRSAKYFVFCFVWLSMVFENS